MVPSDVTVDEETSRWDRIGIGLSGLCAIHCLLMPVALATLPLWSVALDVHEWIHLVFALLLVPVTLLAMRGAHRRQRGATVQMLLGLGLALVVFAVVAHDLVGEWGGTVVTLVGSGFLIAGHWRNWRGRW